MARVTGIGGFFFRAQNPEALNRWYAEHFGVVMIDSRGHDDPGWFQDRGECVFSAFSRDSDSFGAAEKGWKINFRVDDLDMMVDQLRQAGVSVAPHAEPYPNGLFAELEDPEGNHIQLWVPNDVSIARDPGAAEQGWSGVGAPPPSRRRTQSRRRARPRERRRSGRRARVWCVKALTPAPPGRSGSAPTLRASPRETGIDRERPSDRRRSPSASTSPTRVSGVRRFRPS